MRAPSLLRYVQHNGNLATPSSGSDATTKGGWQGSRAMQALFVLRLEFALSKSDELAPREITRLGLQDDMTFNGPAAALNRSWNVIEGTLAGAGHRLRGYKCGRYGRQDSNSLRTQGCQRRLRGSAANTQHCMHVGLGQPAEALTQTVERLENALKTLQCIDRFACDQHDHVSFANAWMLMSRGVAHALDYHFRLVPPLVMAPLQRRLEGGLRQTLSVLLGSAVSE